MSTHKRPPQVRHLSFDLSLLHLHGYTNAPVGLCEDVLTHPCKHASYVVSVRQYRSLQSCFLQFQDHSWQPCSLLMRIDALHTRDLHPLLVFLRKLTPHSCEADPGFREGDPQGILKKNKKFLQAAPPRKQSDFKNSCKLTPLSRYLFSRIPASWPPDWW